MSPSNNASAEVDPSRPSLEDAITNPGTVKINVQGAYIVDDQPPTPDSIPDGDGVHYERKDIRLPHHTSVVSHVAVDVSVSKDKSPPAVVPRRSIMR
jgi:type II pantothenate kinase